jgi:leucyl aminopeptidase
MPLCEDADDALKSDVADWKNCTEGRLQPDALHAARFLQKFIPENTPWAHLDIAGMIEGNGKTKLAPKGYRGFAVQTLFDVCMAGQVAD